MMRKTALLSEARDTCTRCNPLRRMRTAIEYNHDFIMNVIYPDSGSRFHVARVFTSRYLFPFGWSERARHYRAAASASTAAASLLRLQPGEIGLGFRDALRKLFQLFRGLVLPLRRDDVVQVLVARREPAPR